MAVGHPVDVATGTLFNYYQDFSLRGAVALPFWRYYSTALIARGVGVLGFGWRHCYQHELRQTLEGFVYADAEGNETPIIDDGTFASSGRLLIAGKTLELRGTADRVELENYAGGGSMVLVFVRRPNSRLFDLASLQIHVNNRLDLQYDANHRLVTVTQSRSGNAAFLAYDNLGRVREVTFLAGTRALGAAFGYDPQGNLSSVSDAAGVTAQYLYDVDHFMTSDSVRGGSVHEFHYDAQHRCIRALGPANYESRLLQYDAAARTTRVTDSKGFVETYEYNDQGQVTAFTDPMGNVLTYAYDAEGRLTKEVTRRGVKFEHVYDALGHEIAVKYSDGSTYQIEWSDGHRPVACTGPSGLTWKYEYDVNRQLKRSENPLGHAHEYEYDDFGQLIGTKLPNAAVYRFDYNAAGYLARFIEPNGSQTLHETDRRGNVLRLVDAAGAATTYAYDVFDRLLEVTNADGNVWRTTYDNQGRLARQISPNGEYVEYQYNTCGLMTAIRRADGVVARCDWDTEPGRILAIHDGNGNSLRYAYDALGRPVERTNWDGSVSRFEFDQTKNVTAVTGPDGSRQEFEYDDFDQMVLRRSGDEVVAFEYDVNGFMTAAKSARHSVSWERDLYGRAVAEVQDGHRVEYDFDEVGHRRAMRTALGEEVSYGWDSASHLSSTALSGNQIRFDYDVRGLEMTRHFTGGGRFDRRYDVLGRLTQEVFTPPVGPTAPVATIGQHPLALNRDYTYTQNGNLQLVRDSWRGATELVHDPVGQLRAITRFQGSAEYYDYDAASNCTAVARVTSPAPPPPAQSFVPGFGPNSFNRATLNAAGAQLEGRHVGPGNRVQLVTRATETLQYVFDASGFLKEKHVSRIGAATEIWRYEWDVDGRLAQLVRPDGAIWRYEYDPMGRRLKKVGPSGSTEYVWDGTRILHQLESGQPALTYVHHPENYHLLLSKRGDETQFVLPNQLCGVSEVVKADGVAAWWQATETWGTPLAPSSGQPGYPGQWLDGESGLFYNHFRYYDSDLGRYISPDPIGLLGGLNEYAYVPSPFEGFDPDGLAKALGGGPMDYPYKVEPGKPPNLRTDRRVDGGGQPPYGSRTVPKPGNPGPDSGGKCLAVLRGPEGQQAFVSGQGRPPIHSTMPPEAFNVHGGQMGNWTHAEMQSLNHLHKNGTPGEYTLYVDRPACGQCKHSVLPALQELEAKGIKVKVYFMKTDEEGDTKFGKPVTANETSCG